MHRDFTGFLQCIDKYAVRYVDTSKENSHVFDDYLAQKPNEGTLVGKSISLGIRVVFHIDTSKVIIDGGSGTKENPYTLKMGVLTSDASDGTIAQIGTKTYPSLQSAINASRNDTDTIVLLEDVAESISIPANKNVKINLNEHTISNSLLEPTVTFSGKLTITDGTITGEGTRAILVNEIGDAGVKIHVWMFPSLLQLLFCVLPSF